MNTLTVNNTDTAAHTLPNIIIERGKRAYQHIKRDSKTLRENWRMVGEALLIGRREHEADRAFKQWCDVHGFGDLHRNDRAAAMWMAENWNTVVQHGDALETHPRRIRETIEASRKTAVLSEELQSVTSAPAVTLDRRSAERVTKVLRHARRGEDTEAETARRHVEILAKKHGVTVDQLERAAARKVPELYHGLTPGQIEAVAVFKEYMRTIHEPDFREHGLEREVIADLLAEISDEYRDTP